MSVTSTASSARPHPQGQDEPTIHDRRVSMDGMHIQYLEAGAGAPAEFVTEHHALARRPGQLEASTATARALFGPTGQRQILLQHLPTLTTPTLLVWGGCDYVLPAHHAQTAVNLLPDGRLSMFPDCGHLPHIEQPDRFAAVLGDWLTQHRDQPQSPPSTPITSRDLEEQSILANPQRRTA